MDTYPVTLNLQTEPPATGQTLRHSPEVVSNNNKEGIAVPYLKKIKVTIAKKVTFIPIHTSFLLGTLVTPAEVAPPQHPFPPQQILHDSWAEFIIFPNIAFIFHMDA